MSKGRALKAQNSGGNQDGCTSDDDIFEATGDSAVSLFIEECLVTSLQPSDALNICDQSLRCLLRVVPVSFSDLVSRNIELSSLTHWHDSALGVDYLRPRMR